nr:unnamed protein product [Callosobruchus chinensis]
MCKADGFPMPKIIWRREDGQAINIERQKKGTYNKSIDSYTYIYTGCFISWDFPFQEQLPLK